MNLPSVQVSKTSDVFPLLLSTSSDHNSYITEEINSILWFIDPCDPNPCENDGTCLREGEDGYRCDCYSTGFRGMNCDAGE